jgi:hypothetical protein
MVDVVNEEYHDDPEQQNGQVTARREVGYLQDGLPIGHSQEQSKSSNKHMTNRNENRAKKEGKQKRRRRVL